MPETSPTIHPRTQIAAIAGMRWRMFVHSLRTTRGKLEVVSHIFVAFAFGAGGLVGAFSIGVASYFSVAESKPAFLALLFWILFIFWQVFPIIANAFANNPDSSDLLRFPLSYRSYFLVRLAYGAFDPATALGSLWSFAILLGIGLAKPALLPWALLVIVAFAAFNLLFMQMIFAWMERWLAQRRTREIMAVLFFVFILSFQLIGPLDTEFQKRARPDVHAIRRHHRASPAHPSARPGRRCHRAGCYSRLTAGFRSFALLCAFGLAIACCLHVRLLAQYRGENLSEVAAPSTLPKDRRIRLGWNLPGFPTPVAAVFEKEIRYLLRSGPMLLTLIMPLFVLFIFRFGAMNSVRHSGAFLARTSDMAFPAAAGYTLLMLTNLVCNSFGGDAGGIQFFFASPVSFREIVLAKNLTHAGILARRKHCGWIAVSHSLRPAALDVTVAALAGLIFAAPLNFPWAICCRSMRRRSWTIPPFAVRTHRK